MHISWLLAHYIHIFRRITAASSATMFIS